jgi:hypothetical protein
MHNGLCNDQLYGPDKLRTAHKYDMEELSRQSDRKLFKVTVDSLTTKNETYICVGLGGGGVIWRRLVFSISQQFYRLTSVAANTTLLLRMLHNLWHVPALSTGHHWATEV